MNLIGDRWSVMLLRDLIRNDGVLRFQDFLDSQKGLTPKTLSSRLKSFEANKIVKREMYSDHPPRAQYRLTKKGWDLGPIVLAMKKWGTKYKQAIVA